MGTTEGQMTDLVTALYVRKYGKPDRAAEYTSVGSKKIHIFKWNEICTAEGVTMYATAGSADLLGTAERGSEFFIGLTPDADGIADALAEVALTGSGTGKPPSAGDSLTLAYPLWPGTEMRTFLFTDGSELIPSYSDSSRSIYFLQLVPLFPEELEFKKKHGEAALWSKFEAASIPYWDSTRVAASFE